MRACGRKTSTSRCQIDTRTSRKAIACFETVIACFEMVPSTAESSCSPALRPSEQGEMQESPAWRAVALPLPGVWLTPKDAR